MRKKTQGKLQSLCLTFSFSFGPLILTKFWNSNPQLFFTRAYQFALFTGFPFAFAAYTVFQIVVLPCQPRRMILGAEYRAFSDLMFSGIEGERSHVEKNKALFATILTYVCNLNLVKEQHCFVMLHIQKSSLLILTKYFTFFGLLHVKKVECHVFFVQARAGIGLPRMICCYMSLNRF